MCLSREKDQSIVIAGNITVTVLDIRGNVVRLGIVAPRDVTVNRNEVEDRINRDRRQNGGQS